MYILLRCDLGSDDASRGGQSAVGWRWNRSGHISSSIEARDISLERSLQRDFRGVIWTGKCQVVNLYPADENPCQAVPKIVPISLFWSYPGVLVAVLTLYPRGFLDVAPAERGP